MSCYARHGKLFDKYSYIHDLLIKNGFIVEHENIYYSIAVNSKEEDNNIKIILENTLSNNHFVYNFFIDCQRIGGCEIHLINEHQAYLRWIYINENLTNKGFGSKCINSILKLLQTKKITKLDTDTSVDNLIAQKFYEKNNFKKIGLTRSYFLKK